MRCYEFMIEDGDGNELDLKETPVVEYIGKDCDKHRITIILKKNQSQEFSDDESKLIAQLLYEAIEYGHPYPKMKRYINLLEKITEKNNVNQ